MKIQSFTDLDTWREAHKLALFLYQVTKTYPAEERYGLVDQTRRAAVSVTSNIAEGFARNCPKEKGQFFYMALASLREIQNQTILAKDLSYLDPTKYEHFLQQSNRVGRLLNGLIRSSKRLGRLL